jgi:hypothetical protein
VRPVGSSAFSVLLAAAFAVPGVPSALASDADDREALGAPRFAPQLPSAATWSALGSNGAGDGALNGQVTAIAISGANVYVGGWFTNAGGIPEADYVAMWNGSAWSALGSNGSGDGAIVGPVTSLAISGSLVYVGGGFGNAGGINEADSVAVWNSSSHAWGALGSNGAGNGALNGTVTSIAISGNNVYVAGYFTDAAGIATADYLARWNGSWAALGSNGAGNGALNNPVLAVVVSGSVVYAGGQFTNAAGLATADYIARWNSGWSALGSDGAGNGALGGWVHALALSGGGVYAGGGFQNAGGLTDADYVARWSGTAWSALGSTGPGGGAINNTVFALRTAVTDLFIGGQFGDKVFRWDGATWTGLGAELAGGSVNALALSGGTLYAGGAFANAAAIPTADRIAAYGPVSIYQPDGRIKKGSGALAGNNTYNTNASGQSRSGSALRGSSITFTISIQNDGNVTDKFKVSATGTGGSGYSVKYYRGTTEITSAVNTGTYQTANVAVGGTYAITAKVKVLSGATVGSSVTRLVTLTSVASGAKVDAVKFTGKRA